MWPQVLSPELKKKGFFSLLEIPTMLFVKKLLLECAVVFIFLEISNVTLCLVVEIKLELHLRPVGRMHFSAHCSFQ
jgi:hypothetical protein